MKYNSGSVLSTQLKIIPVLGGDVLHVIKSSDSTFRSFGEVYFSKIEHGHIKAWKRHAIMTLNLVVPVGCVQFVFLVDEVEGIFHSEIIGENSYKRLTVSPGIWFGFKGIGAGTNLVMNFSDIEHDPNEVEKCENLDFNFNW